MKTFKVDRTDEKNAEKFIVALNEFGFRTLGVIFCSAKNYIDSISGVNSNAVRKMSPARSSGKIYSGDW